MPADPHVSAYDLQGSDGASDWRVLADAAAAWFVAQSYAHGAQLIAHVASAVGEESTRSLGLDLRPDGVQVSVPNSSGGFSAADIEIIRAVSAAAADLDMVADPSALQSLQVAIDALDIAAVRPFWRDALGYVDKGGEDAVDPGRRFPPIWFQQQDQPRPERNRIHVDASRRHELGREAKVALLARGAREAFAIDYYATMADPEGNEVDLVPLVPDDRLGDDPSLSDWCVIFGAMVCYPTASFQQSAELASVVGAAADSSGAPALIDIRPGAVTIDSGKDRWEDPRFAAFATRVQSLARERGLVADLDQVRFMQLGIDAVDVPAVREFWRAALGYVEDPREGLTDIDDPRWLAPPIIFQSMAAEEVARREQRNRIHLDVFVPDDQVQARIAAALAAGGRLISEKHAPFGWTIADPEGNEIDFAVMVGREEARRVRQQSSEQL